MGHILIDPKNKVLCSRLAMLASINSKYAFWITILLYELVTWHSISQIATFFLEGPHSQTSPPISSRRAT